MGLTVDIRHIVPLNSIYVSELSITWYYKPLGPPAVMILGAVDTDTFRVEQGQTVDTGTISVDRKVAILCLGQRQGCERCQQRQEKFDIKHCEKD